MTSAQSALQPALRLNDGHDMPCLGFGVWQIPDENTPRAVTTAIDSGYRLIDTAEMYGNERGVGEAVRRANVPRTELFITTKLWHDNHGFDAALRAFDDSMKRLKLDSLDLYLIHWPAPSLDAYVDTWRALLRLREEGRATSIGVANFNAAQIQRLADENGAVPAVNQVELHPHFQQTALRSFHAAHGIATQAWAPLGRGQVLDAPALGTIAAKHGRTAAQIVLRWHLQSGIIAIPKSARPERIRANLAITDFALDMDDLARISALDRRNGRIGPDPETFPG